MLDNLINLDRTTSIAPATYGGGIIFSFCNNAVKITCKDSSSRDNVIDIISSLLSGETQKDFYEFKDY